MHLGFICEASKEEEYSELESQVQFWKRRPPKFVAYCIGPTTYQLGMIIIINRDPIGSSGLPIPHQASMCLRRRHQSKRCQDRGEKQKASPE